MSGERRSESLEPPKRRGTEDPGAHELETSDSDEHFSDAPESAGSNSPAGATSPVPRTRVEKVDDEPSYGEVPGTEAYEKRTNDAEPDEIAVMTPAEAASESSDHSTVSVPKTVVDESVDAPGSTTHENHHHEADATPDMVRKPDDTGDANPALPATETTQETTDASPQQALSHRRRKSSAAATTLNSAGRQVATNVNGSDEEVEEEEEGDDDFGDDFDDFEEGDEDADFGDFDDGFQGGEADAAAAASVPSPLTSIPSFPILDLDGLDPDGIQGATEPYLDALYPPDIQELPTLPSPPKENPIFFNPRSASLWSQLAAPPPLQPPDWIRSRIRRLFLVSLGVPVDLDEILPASKQKKLVLPSLQRTTSNGSLRTSTDSRSASRLRRPDANNSTVSVDSQGKEKPSSGLKRRKGPPQAPDLDLVSAKQLCTTTEEALGGMTDGELKEHVKKLEAIEVLAKEVLEYWTKRTDEKIGDREAFEGVIENLVKHARKTRK